MSFFLSLMHVSVARARQYPFDFLMSIFEGASLFLINYLFFSLTTTSSTDTLLLVAVYQLFNGIFYGLFIDNITGLKYYINQGDMDWMILKPVDAQFYLSFRYINFGHLISALFSIPLFIWIESNYTLSITFINFLLFLIFLILSIINAYNLLMTCTALSMLYSDSGNISGIVMPVIQLAKYPKRMYSSKVLPFLLVLLPSLVTVNMAKDALLGQWSFLELSISVLVSVLLCILNRKLFFKAIDQYIGTGS